MSAWRAGITGILAREALALFTRSTDTISICRPRLGLTEAGRAGGPDLARCTALENLELPSQAWGTHTINRCGWRTALKVAGAAL